MGTSTGGHGDLLAPGQGLTGVGCAGVGTGGHRELVVWGWALWDLLPWGRGSWWHGDLGGIGTWCYETYYHEEWGLGGVGDGSLVA